MWIDYLRGRDRPHVEFLRGLLPHPLVAGLTHLIYVEILQGARNPTAFDQLRIYFGGQRFYTFADATRSHASAARIYLDCRQSGVTVRSTVDCLIAQCAIESRAGPPCTTKLDFKRIAHVVPSLNEKELSRLRPKAAGSRVRIRTGMLPGPAPGS